MGMYRGKHHETNEWIYGSLVKMKGGGYAILDGTFSPEHEEVFLNVLEFQAVKYKTVGQFTGLQDKNGKDIYEGDILRSDNEYDVIVFWDDDSYSGRLVCDDSHSCKDMSYHLNYGKGHEIIGNIHEDK